MKFKLTLTLVVFSTFYCNCQKANVFILDLVTNQMDTIRFGYDQSATIGIDSFLGEKNIRWDSLKSLDFRILQRDSIDFYCLNPFEGKLIDGDIKFDSIYYSPSFDSKVNYRPKYSLNRFFEIFMHYENDVRIRFEFNEKMKYFLDRMILFFRQCPYSKPIVVFGDDPNVSESETMLFNAFDTGYHMIWVFKDTFNIVKVTNELDDESYIKIHPNPFHNFISLEFNGNFKQFEIINSFGQSSLKDRNIVGLNYYEIRTNNWLPGFYYLRVLDNKENRVIIKKLIKT